MGRQINFVMHDSELDLIDQLIDKDGEALRYLWRYCSKDHNPLSITEYDNNKECAFYLAPHSMKNAVYFRISDTDPPMFFPDDDRSPIVQYIRPSTDQRSRLSPGRLYYQTRYFILEEMAFREPPIEFLRWANRLLSRVRRALVPVPRHPGLYTGPKTLKMIQDGTAHVASETYGTPPE